MSENKEKIKAKVNVLGCWLKGTNCVSTALFVVAAALILMMTLFLSYDVLMRYLLRRPLPFSDEIGAYLLVAICFLGLAYTLREGRHINIDLITRLLNTKTRRRTSIVISLLSLVTIVVLTWQAFKMVASSYRDHVATFSVLGTPLWIPQLFVAIGLLAFSLQMVSQLITVLQKTSGRE